MIDLTIRVKSHPKLPPRHVDHVMRNLGPRPLGHGRSPSSPWKLDLELIVELEKKHHAENMIEYVI